MGFVSRDSRIAQFAVVIAELLPESLGKDSQVTLVAPESWIALPEAVACKPTEDLVVPD